MIEILRKEDCVGCNACAQRCPKSCISMHSDDEGFLYPEVDKNLCIHCGLCEKVCPIIDQSVPRSPITTYAASNPDIAVKMESSSGGVFTAIAIAIIQDGGVVFGARFNENWEVIHDYTDCIDGLVAFRGSKYVQSRIDDNFLKAEQFLKEGRKVLFSGTPCQIAGLRKFLRKDYANLLTLDVVCHGVPSPGVWKEYLRYIERPEGAEKNTVCQSALNNKDKPVITDISFRDKRISWEKYGLSVRSVAADGRDRNSVCQSGKSDDLMPDEFEYFQTFGSDLYMQVFLKDLNLRPSCYACPAKCGKSHSDITLADFWGIRHEMPEIYETDGVSLVLANSEIGRKLLTSLPLKLIEASYESALRHNLSIERSVKSPEKRKDFWKQYHENGFDGVRNLIASMQPSLIEKIIWKAKHMIVRGFPFLHIIKHKLTR